MKEHLTHVGAVLILFTAEETEDAEVSKFQFRDNYNLYVLRVLCGEIVHFRTEMNYNGLPAYVVNQNKRNKR